MEAYELCNIAKNVELINAIQKIRDHCARTDVCANCICRRDGLNCLLRENPHKWDINEIAENMMGE